MVRFQSSNILLSSSKKSHGLSTYCKFSFHQLLPSSQSILTLFLTVGDLQMQIYEEVANSQHCHNWKSLFSIHVITPWLHIISNLAPDRNRSETEIVSWYPIIQLHHHFVDRWISWFRCLLLIEGSLWYFQRGIRESGEHALCHNHDNCRLHLSHFGGSNQQMARRDL